MGFRAVGTVSGGTASLTLLMHCLFTKSPRHFRLFDTDMEHEVRGLLVWAHHGVVSSFFGG